MKHVREARVTCQCGAVRMVSGRQARRIKVQGGTNYCLACRTSARPVTEDDRIFWLRWAGCVLQPGQTAAEYVAEHGIPRELLIIAAALSPRSEPIAA